MPKKKEPVEVRILCEDLDAAIEFTKKIAAIGLVEEGSGLGHRPFEYGDSWPRTLDVIPPGMLRRKTRFSSSAPVWTPDGGEVISKIPDGTTVEELKAMAERGELD